MIHEQDNAGCHDDANDGCRTQRECEDNVECKREICRERQEVALRDVGESFDAPDECEAQRRQGNHRAAFSCVLRTFQNQRVLGLPSVEEIQTLQSEFPDMRIEILATEGQKLSQQMQDTCSYRYGLLNIGGRDKEEILEKFDYCKSKLRFLFEPV